MRLLRTWISCWLCALAATGYGQQTLHLIYTANPFPRDSIYQGCQVDERNATELFTEIATLAGEEGQPLVVQHHRPDYTKRELLRFLNDLSPAPEDAVVFMFSGHGIEDPAQNNWPLLYYCDEPETEAFDFDGCGLSLERIHELLRATGVRMSLAIASSCNHDPLLEEDEQVVRSLEESHQLTAVTNHDFGLFTRFRGHVIASASKAGQPAYLTDEHGSYYVRALLDAIIDGLVAEGGSSWSQILRGTDQRVQQGFGKEQEAQFLIRSADPAATPGADLSQLIYLLLEETMTEEEELPESDLDALLERVLTFYDEFLTAHQPGYSAEAGYHHFLEALDTYGSEAFDRRYLEAVDVLAYLPLEQQDTIDDFLYPTTP